MLGIVRGTPELEIYDVFEDPLRLGGNERRLALVQTHDGLASLSAHELHFFNLFK